MIAPGAEGRGGPGREKGGPATAPGLPGGPGGGGGRESTTSPGVWGRPFFFPGGPPRAGAAGLAVLGGALAAFAALGHVEQEAAGLAASACDGFGGRRRAVAVGVEHDDVCSPPRIAQRDRPADAGGAAGDRRNVLLEKARHFPPPPISCRRTPPPSRYASRLQASRP